MIRALAVITSLTANAAHADPLAPPQPAVPPTDTRSEGPVARNTVEAWLGYAHIFAPASDTRASQDVGIYAFQLNLGPPVFHGQYADVLGALHHYAVRVSGSVLRYHAADDDSALSGGPISVSLLRYFPLGPIALAPLLHVHTGISFTLATPWLAERHAEPPVALREVAGVDSEFEQSGWSLRPLGAFIRADFLACRSAYLEFGGGFEGFLPSGRPSEVDARYHAVAGLSLACEHADDTVLHHVAVIGEYRGRSRLYSGDSAVRHHDALSLALQIDIPWRVDMVIEGFLTVEPGAMGTYQMLGLRLQFGGVERHR